MSQCINLSWLTLLRVTCNLESVTQNNSFMYLRGHTQNVKPHLTAKCQAIATNKVSKLCSIWNVASFHKTHLRSNFPAFLSLLDTNPMYFRIYFPYNIHYILITITIYAQPHILYTLISITLHVCYCISVSSIILENVIRLKHLEHEQSCCCLAFSKHCLFWRLRRNLHETVCE